MNPPYMQAGGGVRGAGQLSAQRSQDLASLRAQLRSELQRLETAQPAQEPPRSPSTLEEIEALEQSLRDAMAELEARKAELAGRKGDEDSGSGDADDGKVS